MGLRAALQGKRVYFDSNVFIYLVEGFPEFADALNDIRFSLRSGQCQVFSSELTLCETLVVPFRGENAELVQVYRQLLEESGAVTLVPTTRNIYVRASFYRAQMGLRTPDAIHVASAVQAGCQIFLSNDNAIRVPKDIELLRLEKSALTK